MCLSCDLARTEKTREVAACHAIRQAFTEVKVNVAIGLTLGLRLRKCPTAEARGAVEALELIDRNAALRGYLTDSDDRLRWMLYHAAVAALRFDPRDNPADPSQAVTVIEHVRPVEVISFQAKALPAPSAPLRSGDWAGLYQLVKQGAVTDSEAQSIAAIWLGHGARA